MIVVVVEAGGRRTGGRRTRQPVAMSHVRGECCMLGSPGIEMRFLSMKKMCIKKVL